MRGKIIELEAIKILREGKREGARNKGREIALNLIRLGISGNTILEATGFSRKELDEMAKNNNLNVTWNDDEAMLN